MRHRSAYDEHRIPFAARALRLRFVHSNAPQAVAEYERLVRIFSEVFPMNLDESDNPDVVISLGGDGFLLSTLRAFPTVPVYGINCGHVGFLTNEKRDELRAMRLLREVHNANRVMLPLLQVSVNGTPPVFAFNEVVVARSSTQAAHLSVEVNGETVVPFLCGDGILVATPCGSTAYNLSAGGYILPLSSDLLALTPICPYRPRHLPCALLDGKDLVKINNLDPESKRPLRVSYDDMTFPEPVTSIDLRRSDRVGILLLDNDSEHRIFMERFSVGEKD